MTAICTGVISFGLVSIPVRLSVATESKDVRFNLLHREDQSRIKERYYCPEDGELLEQDQLVRGYEIGRGSTSPWRTRTWTRSRSARSIPSRSQTSSTSARSPHPVSEDVLPGAGGRGS